MGCALFLMVGGCSLGELRGVARPVAAGLVHPADGCGGVQAEEVGQDGRGNLGCEVGECGPPSGLGRDAEGSEPFCEPGRGDGAAGQQPGEQPSAIGARADAGVGLAVVDQREQQAAERVGDGDLVPGPGAPRRPGRRW